MLKDVRTAAGLGSPPSKFTTNASESLNAVLKRKVDYSATQWPLFNDCMKEIVVEQRDEIVRALSGRGKYQFCKPYEHLQVLPQEWAKMTPDQRKRLIKKFDDAAVRVQTSHRASVSTSGSLSSQPSTSDAASNEKYLSVVCEDSGIENIPFVTLHSIWVKAEEYLNSSSDIVAAPGGNKKAKMVSSKSSITPHFVRCLSSGQYVCDNNCLQWKSSQICAHVVAVAELNGELNPFLQWYKSSNQQPNITALAMNKLPAGRGCKGGVPKRKRTQTVSPEVFVQRPGTCKPPQIPITGTSSEGLVSPPVTQVAISSSNPIFAQVLSCDVASLSHVVGPSPAASVAPNINPFFVRIIQGNIRMCQGCRTSLRNVDGSIPLPPYDLAVARYEKRSYRDKFGELHTPQREQAVHYHIKLLCIRSSCADFVPASLVVPTNVRSKLTPSHKEYLRLIFGINC